MAWLFVVGNSVKEIEKFLSCDFRAMGDWITANKLVLNMKKDKTKCVLFDTNQKVKQNSLEIAYQDRCINKTTGYKYLRLKLDHTLLLNKHFNSTYKKASGRLYLLSRPRNKLNVKVLLVISRSHILPLFTYCSVTTCNLTNMYKKKLKRV